MKFTSRQAWSPSNPTRQIFKQMRVRCPVVSFEVSRVCSHKHSLAGLHDTLITALQTNRAISTQLRATTSLFNIFLTRHRHRSLQRIQGDFKLYEIISHSSLPITYFSSPKLPFPCFSTRGCEIDAVRVQRKGREPTNRHKVLHRLALTS